MRFDTNWGDLDRIIKKMSLLSQSKMTDKLHRDKMIYFDVKTSGTVVASIINRDMQLQIGFRSEKQHHPGAFGLSLPNIKKLMPSIKGLTVTVSGAETDPKVNFHNWKDERQFDIPGYEYDVDNRSLGGKIFGDLQMVEKDLHTWAKTLASLPESNRYWVADLVRISSVSEVVNEASHLFLSAQITDGYTMTKVVLNVRGQAWAGALFLHRLNLVKLMKLLEPKSEDLVSVRMSPSGFQVIKKGKWVALFEVLPFEDDYPVEVSNQNRMDQVFEVKRTELTSVLKRVSILAKGSKKDMSILAVRGRLAVRKVLPQVGRMSEWLSFSKQWGDPPVRKWRAIIEAPRFSNMIKNMTQDTIRLAIGERGSDMAVSEVRGPLGVTHLLAGRARGLALKEEGNV